jgi:heme exporter protein D
LLILWFAIVLIEASLCGLLWMLRQQRVYPAFTYFISFQVAESFGLFALQGHDETYFYAYWISAAVDVVLKLALVIEIFHSVYQKQLIEREVIRRFYYLLTVIGLLSFALSFRFPSQYPVRLLAVIRTADTGASLALCVSFLAVVAGAWWDGLYWLRHACGIGYGLLLYLPLRLVIKVISLSADKRTIAVLNWVEMLAFLGTLLIWTRTFIMPEVVRATVSAEVLRQRVRELKQSDISKALR